MENGQDQEKQFEGEESSIQQSDVGCQDDYNDVTTKTVASVRSEPLQDDNGPPKVDSEVEILHEKVTKQIIKEGRGQKPANFSTCFCKFHFIIHTISWS